MAEPIFTPIATSFETEAGTPAPVRIVEHRLDGGVRVYATEDASAETLVLDRHPEDSDQEYEDRQAFFSGLLAAAKRR